jgi:hypothetical protein
LHDEEFHDLYCSPNVIQLIKLWLRWVGHVTCVFKKRSAYRFLVWKAEENRAFGKCKLRWEGIVKIYLKDVGWEGIHWIYVAGG